MQLLRRLTHHHHQQLHSGSQGFFFFFFSPSLSCCVDVLECNEQSLSFVSFVNRCQGSEQTLQPSRPETDRRGRKEKEPTDDVPQSTYVEPHRCP